MSLTLSPKFPRCGERPIGLYPCVTTLAWIERLAPLGIDSIQLYCDDALDLLRIIAPAKRYCEQYRIRLFIHRHWQIALEHGVYGVHVEACELAQVDLNELQQAKLRLGITVEDSNSFCDILPLGPSYIALNPVFRTHPVKQSQLEDLAYLCQQEDVPIVAAGGINMGNIDRVLACQPDGVAIEREICQNAHPELTTQRLLARLHVAQLAV